ncbi:hypothetical protein [Paenibacillus sp. sgz500958]|uniref:hypothetical protein n=1 Tax=Paenibacillus sp. sgz500958 TaxID=3242475 RepID=UPI0036D26E7B
MSEHYDSSLPTNTNVSQAQGSVNKLHNSISQALSHPSEQTLEQAENSLQHTRQAIHRAKVRSVDGQGVELVEEALAEEEQRFGSIPADTE